MSLPVLTLEKTVWVFLAAMLHAATGYLFVSVLTPYAPRYGLLGGLIPDLDIVFLVLGTSSPFVHRGITHTLFFLLALILVLWLSRVREDAIHGIGIGVGVHLIFDTISGWGVMWFWPLHDARVFLPLQVNGQRNLTLIVTLALTIAILLPPKRRFQRI